MAQSAVKERALLGIELFWERPNFEPLLKRERWQIMLKLAIFAKEGISIDTLREDLPNKVTLPPELIYEAKVKNARLKVKEIGKLEMNNSRIHGSIGVRKMS